MKVRAHLSEVVEIFDETQRIASSIHETEALVEDEQDDELKELAEQTPPASRTLPRARRKAEIAAYATRSLAVKAVIMEIRRARAAKRRPCSPRTLPQYTRYADGGWNLEVMNMNETELGGEKRSSFRFRASRL